MIGLPWIKIAVGAAVIAAAVFAVFSYNRAITRAEELSAQLAEADARTQRWVKAAETLARDVERQGAALETREADRKRAEKELRDANQRLERLRREDASVGAWWDQRLPDGLAGELRHGAGGTAPAVPAAPGKPAD